MITSLFIALTVLIAVVMTTVMAAIIIELKG
jgi:hypothetical protein